LNMRKPDLEIYQEVLRLSKTNASEALFMDDKLENLNGALSVGINTFHITEPNKIFDLQKYV
jgi:glucose-1-phosphatase